MNPLALIECCQGFTPDGWRYCTFFRVSESSDLLLLLLLRSEALYLHMQASTLALGFELQPVGL